MGISNGGFKYIWTYPGDRALGLRQDSKFIRGTIKVRAEILVLANGNNQQLARAGPHAHGTRKGSSYKAGEPVGSGSGDSGQSSVAELGKMSLPRVRKERDISQVLSSYL